MLSSAFQDGLERVGPQRWRQRICLDVPGTERKRLLYSAEWKRSDGSRSSGFPGFWLLVLCATSVSGRLGGAEYPRALPMVGRMGRAPRALADQLMEA